MDVPRSLIDTFVTVTNAEPSVASQLLGDNGLDLEAAIASFFAIQEAGGGPPPGDRNDEATPHLASSGGQGSDNDIQVVENNDVTEGGLAVEENLAQTTAAAALAADEALARQLAEEPTQDDEVRAPIPERIEQMLPGSSTGRGGLRPSRRAYAVDDPFLQSDGSAHGDTLAALFRPPTELISQDDFDTAMAKGQREKKWLLVNMQRTGVFLCHMLNRDVWADPAVRDLVQSRFVFWQRDELSEDGLRYKQFYPYGEPPHVAIIDPRSGERLRVWGGDGKTIQKNEIINALVDFCDAESLEDDGPSRQRPVVARPSSASTRPARPSTSSEVIDLDQDRLETEDAQIAAAIAASLDNGDAQRGHDQVSGGVSGDVVMTDDSSGNAGRSHELATAHSEVTANRHTSRLLSATDPGLNHDRSLRAQQDSEYEQSLALDRAKLESEKAEADRIQRAASRLEAKRSRIPSPPAEGCAESTTELVIRLPSGRRLQRRFYGSDTVGSVYDFVDLENRGELSEDSYTLVLPFPRASFTDRDMTLEAADLLRKAALVVDLH